MARRIAVIGTTSGVGKTTLGRELARRLRVPFVELDALHHGPNWTEATPDELRARVDAVLDGVDGWVVDGTYYRKIGPHVLAQADTIVWLDLPVHVWMPRLVRRTVSRIRRDVALWNGNKESWRDGFFRWDGLIPFAVRAHYTQRRAWPTRLAELPHVPHVRLRTPRAVRRWLETIPEAPE